LRDALLALESRRRDEWERLSWGLVWIVNRMPNFSKRSRPPVRLSQLNPYLPRERGGIALNTANRSAEAALDAWANRAKS
jgi:hypothetical protein